MGIYGYIEVYMGIYGIYGYIWVDMGIYCIYRYIWVYIGIYGYIWDKLLKSRRGCLEKLHPRESLKPRDFPKANPRAKPEGLPSENPEAFRLSRGRSFSDNPKAFQQFVRLWFPRGAGTDLP